MSPVGRAQAAQAPADDAVPARTRYCMPTGPLLNIGRSAAAASPCLRGRASRERASLVSRLDWLFALRKQQGQGSFVDDVCVLIVRKPACDRRMEDSGM